jgi:hypothetical protein
MSAKLPGWEEASVNLKVEMLHDWLMQITIELRDHRLAMKEFQEQVQKLHKKE